MLEQSVEEFLDALASAAPTPGGGSVAALTGALGAALLSMVCNLTLGREKYAAVEPQISLWLGETEELRSSLQALVEHDVAVYSELSAAYKLPRATDEERAARTAAIQEALVGATEVPMQVAEACARVLALCRPVAEHGNVNAVSDAGVAVLLAEAGLRSAMLNVLINLKAIRDAEFVTEQRQRLDRLLEGSAAQKEETVRLVMEKL